MHVTVSKKELLRVLVRCQGVADKKSTMPVLGSVALEVVKGDALRLAATDLGLAVTGTIPARVEKPGSIAVGARDLFDRVRMMPDGEISIVGSSASALTLRAVGSARRYTLHGVPGEEFPTLPTKPDTAVDLDLSVKVLSALINATHFSISSDETRLHLNSALFEWEGSVVRMVTTDGHRLSKMEMSAGGAKTNATLLIPLKGILELKRLCEEALAESADEDPKLTLAQSGPHVFFSLAGFQFSIKLVDAQFPPYRQVIPETSERAVRAPRALVADALRAVSLAASDRTGGVRLTLDAGKMRFESESPESGEGFDEIPVDYDGSTVSVGLNAKYFLDVLSAIGDEEVILALSGELDPAVVRPGSETKGSSYVAVIMPMRI